MSRVRCAVRTVGPDAIHLCLTVGERPHLFGCAWASYGEARLPGPRTVARREARPRRARAQRGGPSREGDPRPQGGRACESG